MHQNLFKWMILLGTMLLLLLAACGGGGGGSTPPPPTTCTWDSSNWDSGCTWAS
jgi:predicted small lipoprotein YifL